MPGYAGRPVETYTRELCPGQSFPDWRTDIMDKIHHVAIQVDNIHSAVHWYCDNFDTKVSYEDDSWALLEFGNVSLALVIPEQHPPHFAVENTSAENFGRLTEHRDGTRSVYIRDPYGNTVEIIKKP